MSNFCVGSCWAKRAILYHGGDENEVYFRDDSGGISQDYYFSSAWHHPGQVPGTIGPAASGPAPKPNAPPTIRVQLIAPAQLVLRHASRVFIHDGAEPTAKLLAHRARS